MEIDADEFAGFILNEFGADLDESMLSLKFIYGEQDFDALPEFIVRKQSLTKGWKESNSKYLDSLFLSNLSFADLLLKFKFSPNTVDKLRCLEHLLYKSDQPKDSVLLFYNRALLYHDMNLYFKSNSDCIAGLAVLGNEHGQLKTQISSLLGINYYTMDEFLLAIKYLNNTNTGMHFLKKEEKAKVTYYRTILLNEVSGISRTQIKNNLEQIIHSENSYQELAKSRLALFTINWHIIDSTVLNFDYTKKHPVSHYFALLETLLLDEKFEEVKSLVLSIAEKRSYRKYQWLLYEYLAMAYYYLHKYEDALIVYDREIPIVDEYINDSYFPSTIRHRTIYDACKLKVDIREYN
ncbi:MAG: hypothetical protein M3Q56_09560 [Bacteroidota bacterium]|nr:hypothetical protein [Bacteroidota bacterium]